MRKAGVRLEAEFPVRLAHEEFADQQTRQEEKSPVELPRETARGP